MSKLISNEFLTPENAKRIAVRMAAFGMILAAPTVVKNCLNKPEKKNEAEKTEMAEKVERIQPQHSQKNNLAQRLEQLRPQLCAVIAYAEGYREDYYLCCGQGTIAYGLTKFAVSDNDFRDVTPSDAPMSKKEGRYHMNKVLNYDVIPAITKYVKRNDLTDEQLAACVLFVYNLSCNQFAGKSIYGVKVGNPSEFLLALNRGESDFDCARKLSGFRNAGVLLKRRWIEMALFCGKIKINDLYDMAPGSFNDFRVQDLYQRTEADTDGFFTPKLDSKTIATVLKKGRRYKHKLIDILDKELILSLNKKSTLHVDSKEKWLSLADRGR